MQPVVPATRFLFIFGMAAIKAARILSTSTIDLWDPSGNFLGTSDVGTYTVTYDSNRSPLDRTLGQRGRDSQATRQAAQAAQPRLLPVGTTAAGAAARKCANRPHQLSIYGGGGTAAATAITIALPAPICCTTDASCPLHTDADHEQTVTSTTCTVDAKRDALRQWLPACESMPSIPVLSHRGRRDAPG